MKMAKLRRKNTALERTIDAAREAWKVQQADLRRVEATADEVELGHLQTRRKDLARVAAVHRRVPRAAGGPRRAVRNYCEECNVLWPCRTTEVLGRLGADVDALFAARRRP